MVENEFIIGQNSTNFIVHKGDWENSAVFTYLHIHFLKINSVTIQIVNDIDNIWCSTQKNLIALPLLHFPQNSIAILQYFNELESYWNIAIYCNNSINCNLLQYDAIKQRSGMGTPWSHFGHWARTCCSSIFGLFWVRSFTKSW